MDSADKRQLAELTKDNGFRVQGLGFRVQGSTTMSKKPQSCCSTCAGFWQFKKVWDGDHQNSCVSAVNCKSWALSS